MITLSGLRNFLWCLLAFGIVVCAATPTSLDRRATARDAVIRAQQAQAAMFADFDAAPRERRMRLRQGIQ